MKLVERRVAAADDPCERSAVSAGIGGDLSVGLAAAAGYLREKCPCLGKVAGPRCSFITLKSRSTA